IILTVSDQRFAMSCYLLAYLRRIRCCLCIFERLLQCLLSSAELPEEFYISLKTLILRRAFEFYTLRQVLRRSSDAHLITIIEQEFKIGLLVRKQQHIDPAQCLLFALQ